MGRSKMPFHHLAFTIVELMVVIAIIALLVSILLPALANARVAARRTLNASNLHNQALGLMSCAHDRKNILPEGIVHPGGYDPTFLFIASAQYVGGRDYDLRSVYRRYNILSVTAHPVAGTTIADSPPNTAQVCGPSYFYFPGYTLTGFPLIALYVQSPRQVDRALPGTAIVQDFAAFYAAPYNTYFAAQTQSLRGRVTGDASGRPEAGAFTAASVDDILAATARYDGSVDVVGGADMNFVPYASNGSAVGRAPDRR